MLCHHVYHINTGFILRCVHINQIQQEPIISSDRICSQMRLEPLEPCLAVLHAVFECFWIRESGQLQPAWIEQALVFFSLKDDLLIDMSCESARVVLRVFYMSSGCQCAVNKKTKTSARIWNGMEHCGAVAGAASAIRCSTSAKTTQETGRTLKRSLDSNDETHWRNSQVGGWSCSDRLFGWSNGSLRALAESATGRPARAKNLSMPSFCDSLNSGS